MSTEEGSLYRHSEPKIELPLSTLATVLPLTVPDTDGHPPVALFSAHSSNNATVLFPKWVYIKDRHGHYLSVRSGPVYGTLTFRTGDPDLNCAFEAIGPTAGSWYKFLGRNGNYIMRYYSGWYSADSGSAPFYNVISSTGNYVYFKDNYTTSRFMSDELKESGSPVAHDYINESSRLEIVQAAVKNEVINVQYDIPGKKVLETAPLIALSTSVRNDSDGDVNQTLTYSYEKWKVGTWNNTLGVEIGTKATFKAGVPFVANAQFEVSVSASYSHEWGGEEGTKQTVTSSTTVTVPPKKKARAKIIVRNAQINVGFTYTQKILWSNGQSEEVKQTGIYRNVESWHVDVELDNWQDV